MIQLDSDVMCHILYQAWQFISGHQCPLIKVLITCELLKDFSKSLTYIFWTLTDHTIIFVLECVFYRVWFYTPKGSTGPLFSECHSYLYSLPQPPTVYFNFTYCGLNLHKRVPFTWLYVKANVYCVRTLALKIQ